MTSPSATNTGDGLLPPDAQTGPVIHHTYVPTYHAIWGEILAPSCALPFCHAGSGDYLMLTGEDEGRAALLGTLAQGPCASTGLSVVAPYDAGASLLYLKVSGPPCGARMPDNDNGQTLEAGEIEQIREWISCGALDGDAGCADAASDADLDAGQDATTAREDSGSDASDASGGALSDAGSVDAGAQFESAVPDSSARD